MSKLTDSAYRGLGSHSETFIVSSSLHLTIEAGAGNDFIRIDGFGDFLSGGLGTDIILALDGGQSNPDQLGETIYGDASADPADLRGGADQILGGNGPDTIFGGAGGDFVWAHRGNDYVDGGTGDDFLWGSTGADTVLGGDGADTIFGSSDVLYPIMFSITVDYDGTNDTLLAANDPMRGPYTFANGQASGEVDDAAADRLDGGNGNDLLYGQGGDDTLTGGADEDYLNGGDGEDSLDGGDGFDNLFGGAGDDSMVGGLKDDNLDGGADNDALDGGDGADFLDGGAGNDVLAGGDSFDTLVGGEGLDQLNGGEGIDTLDYSYTAARIVLMLNGANVTTALVGGVGEDSVRNIEDVFGGTGSDTLTGDSGDNEFFGNKGNDVLTGGGGADQLEGGLGKDKFVYGAVSDSTGTGYDTITGFDAKSEHFVFPVAVTGIDATIATGALRDASFDADLHHVVKASKLAAGHAVLFTPASGDHLGETFLIVDGNGVAGYQAGQDYVINLDGAVHLLQLDVGDFSTAVRLHRDAVAVASHTIESATTAGFPSGGGWHGLANIA